MLKQPYLLFLGDAPDALAAKVAAVRQIDLESLARAGAAVGHRGASHGHVVAAEKEEEAVAAETEHVTDEDELNGALGSELELLEDVASEDDADTGAGRDRAE